MHKIAIQSQKIKIKIVLSLLQEIRVQLNLIQLKLPRTQNSLLQKLNWQIPQRKRLITQLLKAVEETRVHR